jgi:hypothetical protein
MPVQKLASISEFLLIRTLWEQSISQKHGPTSIIFNIFCSLLRSSNDPIWSNLIQSDPIWSNGRWCDWDPRTEMTLPAAQGQDGADM